MDWGTNIISNNVDQSKSCLIRVYSDTSDPTLVNLTIKLISLSYVQM